MKVNKKELKKVNDFNAKYAVGDYIEVRDDNGNIFVDKIRDEASIIGGHTAVAWLDVNGSYLIDRVVGPIALCINELNLHNS